MCGEPCLAHPAEVGAVDATSHPHPCDRQGRDENDDDTDKQHRVSRRNHDRPVAILALPHCSVCALVHTASLEGAAIVGHPCRVRRVTYPHRTVAQRIAAAHALPQPNAPRAAVIAHHRREKRRRAVRFMTVWTAGARTRQGRFIRDDHGIGRES
jgi:hypothetical protein